MLLASKRTETVTLTIQHDKKKFPISAYSEMGNFFVL